MCALWQLLTGDVMLRSSVKMCQGMKISARKCGTAARVAVLAFALYFPSCSPFNEAMLRELTAPRFSVPGPLFLSLPKIATQEQRKHAIRCFRQYEEQNQPPQGFWARLAHDHNAKLRRDGVTRIAVPVPTSGKVPAGWMLVDVRSGRPTSQVYQRPAGARMKPGYHVMIGGHKSLVFVPTGSQEINTR